MQVAQVMIHESLIKWGGVHFSKRHSHFEEINQNTFSFHAYTLDKEINKMRADRITRNVKPVCHVNLSEFHVDDASADASRGCRDKVHYVYLKDCNEIVCGKTKNTKQNYFMVDFVKKASKNKPY